ncbi:MAG TPA: putative toxin-antitoxin system toxin component, PIN family [Polyangiaceae bacterium]|nr:putative toxin-antitoxin system toxin component, PIN family [Polyangiaceae bacterium]
MRVVVDTNVLVSALLRPGSVPARALDRLTEAGALFLYDARIVAEYRVVLERPKFRAIDAAGRVRLLGALLAAPPVAHVPPWPGPLLDPDDRMFVEVALAGHADALVTGNLRDYPRDLGFEVLPPASLLAGLEASR